MTDRTANIVLLGGGGHAAVVAEAARAAGHRVLGVLDDREDLPDLARIGLTRLGPIDAAVLVALREGAAVHAAVGSAALRRRWLEALGDLPLATIVDPTAVVSPSATIEDGAFVAPRAAVNARAHIQRAAIVNTGAIVEHDTVIGAFAHVGPGSIIAGAGRVGSDALVGAGAVVLPGRRVGDGATLGAGGVATSDIPDGGCFVGVPARGVAAVVQGGA